MADHSPSVPDYELDDVLDLTEASQFRALFDPTRRQISQLLLERAATTSELAAVLDKPKGTIGHHLKTMEREGLVRVVRRKMVRAIEAKYYGRTARTFLLHDGGMAGAGIAKGHMIATAADEFARSAQEMPGIEPTAASLRHARIPRDQAMEFRERLYRLIDDFVTQPRGGDVTYGMVIGIYPTAQPSLPDARETT